jgi:hypothetical protein
MAGKRAVSDEKKLFDAISTLKRVTGTPNSNIEPGHQITPGRYCVRTTDYESALIMANLISQCIMNLYGHTEKFWGRADAQGQPRPHGGLFTETKVINDGNNEYRINFSFPVHSMGRLADNINEKAQSLIAPDKPSRKR